MTLDNNFKPPKSYKSSYDKASEQFVLQNMKPEDFDGFIPPREIMDLYLSSNKTEDNAKENLEND